MKRYLYGVVGGVGVLEELDSQGISFEDVVGKEISALDTKIEEVEAVLAGLKKDREGKMSLVGKFN